MSEEQKDGLQDLDVPAAQAEDVKGAYWEYWDPEIGARGGWTRKNEWGPNQRKQWVNEPSGVGSGQAATPGKLG